MFGIFPVRKSGKLSTGMGGRFHRNVQSYENETIFAIGKRGRGGRCPDIFVGMHYEWVGLIQPNTTKFPPKAM
jgi:hypothetical protein